MKSFIVASLIASAAAFAPAQQKAQTSALSASFEKEVGSQAPLGFFDPLGMCKGMDQEEFDRVRYVELKHGRIAMLAVVGYLTTASGLRLPGDIDYSGLQFSDVPGGFKAFDVMSGAGAVQIFFFIGWLETCIMKDNTGGEFAGDFRNNYIDFGWDNFDDATKMKKRAIELNNGRAAQMGILALMVHEQMGVPILAGQ